MSNGFILHDKHDPCPVCESTDQRCKTKNDELVLCMGITDALAVPGRRFIGRTKCGTWGQWLPDDRHWSDEEREQHQRDNEARKQARAAAEAKRRAEALPAAQRDQEYRRILASLTLHPDDLADLERRGFTAEQIERSGFKSASQWQRLEWIADHRLAGVNLDGDSLNIQPGYVCPIRDADGNIVGFQNRQRAGGGYRWLSSSTKKRPHGPTAHNEDGELPLAVFEPADAAAGHVIGLAEGTGAKPFLASDRLSIPVIGAAGAQWASSPKTFRRTLDKLSARHKAKRVVLYADAGMLDDSHRSVRDRYYAAAELAQQYGYQVQIAWWGQTDKADGDIDEISDYSQIRYISVDEFKALAGDEVQQRPQQRRKSYEERPQKWTKRNPQSKTDKKARQKQWRRDKQRQDEQRWIREMAQSAGVLLPQGVELGEAKRLLNEALSEQQLIGGAAPEGYFEPIEPAQQGRQLVVLDGQKMTRKSSVALRSAVERAKAEGKAMIIFAPTRILAKRLTKELEDLGAAYYLSSKAARADIVVCSPESAWKFDDRHFDIVGIDEVWECQDRIQKGDLGNHPVRTRKALAKMMRQADEVVIGQDGIPKATLSWAMREGGFTADEVVIGRRRRKPSDMTIKLYHDDATGSGDRWDGLERSDKNQQPNAAFYTWLASLVCDLRQGKKVIVPCGSQERARTLARFIKRILDALPVQVFDGKFTPTKVKVEFASGVEGDDSRNGPDDWIEHHRPTVLIFTPCFNSGVSIETKYFDAQYEAIAVGETAGAASQRGERDRDAIMGTKIKTRHVYLSNRGLPSLPDPQVFFPSYWRELLRRDADKPFDAASGLAAALGSSELLNARRSWARQDMGEIQELPELLAIEARETHLKKECLVREWRGNGWTIQEVEPLPSAELKEMRETWELAREDLLQQNARMRAMARPAELEDESDPEGPIAMVKGERFAMGQKLGQDYDRLSSAEFWAAWGLSTGKSGGVGSMRIQALIRMSVEDPQAWREIKAINAMRAIAGIMTTMKTPVMPVTPKEIETAELLLGCKAVVGVVTGELTQWHKDLPETKAAADYARANAEEFARLSRHSQRLMGFQFTGTTPDIKCLHKMLQISGLEVATDGRQGSGERLWLYRVMEAGDVKVRIDKREENGQTTYDLQRQHYRLTTAEELAEQARKQIGNRLDELRDEWIRVGHYLQKDQGGGGRLELQIGDLASLSEVLDGGYSTLAALMQQCQSWGDFEAIGRYFPLKVRQGVWDWLREHQPEEVKRILQMRDGVRVA